MKKVNAAVITVMLLVSASAGAVGGYAEARLHPAAGPPGPVGPPGPQGPQGLTGLTATSLGICVTYATTTDYAVIPSGRYVAQITPTRLGGGCAGETYVPAGAP